MRTLEEDEIARRRWLKSTIQEKDIDKDEEVRAWNGIFKIVMEFSKDRNKNPPLSVQVKGLDREFKMVSVVLHNLPHIVHRY